MLMDGSCNKLSARQKLTMITLFVDTVA